MVFRPLIQCLSALLLLTLPLTASAQNRALLGGPAPGATAATASDIPESVILPGRTLPAGPQDNAGSLNDPLQNPIFKGMSKEMQDEILKEAADYHAECEADSFFAQKHDCDCLAIRYTNERLQRGPKSSTGVIKMDIRQQCVDVPSTANFAYNKCLSVYKNADTNDLDALCKCYANDFANQYAATTDTNSNMEMNIGAAAMSKCSEQERGMGAP